MVFVSVPARVDCTGKIVPIGNDDDSISLWSSDVSRSTADPREPVMDDSLNFNSPMVHHNHRPPQRKLLSRVQRSQHKMFHQSRTKEHDNFSETDTWNVAKPKFEVIPALDDFKSRYETDEKDEGVAPCHSNCISKISKMNPWGRGNHNWARAEMLQHQLGKPIRALSKGKKAVVKTKAFECFKEKHSEISNSGSETEEAGSSSRGHSESSQSRDFQQHHFFATNMPRNLNKLDKNEWEDFGSSRRLSSCNVWPSSDKRSMSADPPGHYSNARPTVQLHFFNDGEFELAMKQSRLPTQNCDLRDSRNAPASLRRHPFRLAASAEENFPSSGRLSPSFSEENDRFITECHFQRPFKSNMQSIEATFTMDSADGEDEGSAFVLQVGLD